MDSSLAEMGEEELQLKLAELTEKVDPPPRRPAAPAAFFAPTYPPLP